MTEQGMDPKIDGQVNHIIDTFSGKRIDVVVESADRGVSCMYAEGQILVRDEYLKLVRSILKQPDDPDLVQRVVAGVVLLTLSESTEGAQQPRVTDALKDVERQVGSGQATPNHVLTVAGSGGVVGPCPATEPQEVYDGIEPLPGVSRGNDGAGVLIYIADTGMLKGATSEHSWLKGVEGGTDLLPSPVGGIQKIPPYAGHGTFVAGVARCLAPAADVIVSNVFSTAGSALESDLIGDLDHALNLGVDIFNLSITAPTRLGLPLLGFDGWLRRLHQYKGVVCVVAAGNDSSRKPRWPAAYPEMVAVGALADDWSSRAQFSNYGGWVDVYAPGRNLVNAYATGTYICNDLPYKGDKREFHGMARWSGTSFATPVVTGLIAARMSRTGEDGRHAAAALLAQAQSQANPGVGAILLPSKGNNDDVSNRTA